LKTLHGRIIHALDGATYFAEAISYTFGALKKGTIAHLLKKCSKMVGRKLGITDRSITNLLGVALRHR
jgi:hypothetical protein